MIVNNEKINTPLFHLIGEEADKLNLDCYVIGGWVRDLFLHRESKDIDIVVVSQIPQDIVNQEVSIGIELAKAVSHRLKGSHLAVFKTYGTAQVKRGDIELEFVGARKESYQHNSRNPIVENGTLEEDQNRRDFTINALAICLNTNRFGELLDPFGGMKDMEECIIRTPLDPDITFSDDPLRMMRGIRFASQLGFYLNLTTFEAIERNRERIRIITKERIAEELNKIMLSRRPSVGWKLLSKTGLLAIIFPELEALKGIETVEGRGHKDIFEHTLQVLDNVALMESSKVSKFQSSKSPSETTLLDSGTAQALEHRNTGTSNLWLRWAALLHDIGKPKSKRWEASIGWTFYAHNTIGANMIPRIFQRMKLPQNEKMQYIRKLVELHMRPINLIEETVTDSAVRRLLFEAGNDIDDLMCLCDADITSKKEEKVRRFHRNYELLRLKMKEIEEKDRIREFQPPVRGEEIMQVLNLPPCREVGELKNAIKDAILDGLIPNEHDAAFQFMLDKAKEMGLNLPNQDK